MQKTTKTSSRALRFLATAMLLFVTNLATKAYDFEVGGIYYNITSNSTATVTYKSIVEDLPYSDYSGNVVIPETVTYNGHTYKVTTIGDNAFTECSGLTQVTIPENVTTIDDYAFYGCSSLSDITIPNTVTSMGRKTFMYCYNLAHINISNSVSFIGEDSFWDCISLREVVIPNSVTVIEESAFYDCSSLAQVTLGDGLISIGNEAFYGCTALTEVTIPNNVTTIGEDAFEECSGLTNVTIGNGVTMILEHAFAYCERLASVTSLNPEPPTCEEDNVFRDVNTGICVLYVPEGSKEKYASAEVWQDFLNVEEIDVSPVVDILAGGNTVVTGYHTTDGKLLGAPQRGINIIRYSDGTAKKVLMK